jgi:DNA repair protein RAD7
LPDIEMVNLRNAGQLKNDVLRYMAEKNKNIRELQLGATNLISDEVWQLLFQTTGPHLESLKLSELNDSLDDGSIEVMARSCRKLRRLKLRSCSQMTESSLLSISKLTSLEHLTLAVAQDSSSEALSTMIRKIGPSLHTLCLEEYGEADDDVLESIRDGCTKLSKLRLTGSAICSDQAFARLFTDWANPPIPYIDLCNNRDIDNANPEGPQDAPIGLGAAGFKALMNHSGPSLQRLDVHSCRHISHEVLSEVFDGKRQYPVLKDIDMSFVSKLDGFIMTGIFKSCPGLSKLAVFGCFDGRDVRIPAGVALIGLPNAQDTVVIEGDVVGEL